MSFSMQVFYIEIFSGEECSVAIYYHHYKEYLMFHFSVDFFRPEYSAEQMTELDRERLAHGVSNTLLALTPRLKDIHQLLLEPPKVSSIDVLGFPPGPARG